MVRFFISLIVSLAGAAVAWAEPLDLRQLPARAAWVVHVDFDAAGSSIVGKQLRDLWLSQPDGAKAAQRASDIFGMDLTRDLHSVTLYGTNFVPEHGVVMIRGKLDQNRLLALLKNAPGSRHETIGGHEVYFWIDADKPHNRDSKEVRPTAGAFFGNDMIVMGPDANEVSSAIDVLEGKSPALSSDSALSIPDVAGAIVSMAAAGLTDAKEIPIESPIVRSCQSGGVAVGEKDGQLTVRGHILYDTPGHAQNVRDMIVGVEAFARMQNADIQRSKLLDSLSVTVEGKAVDVVWQYKSADLVKMATEMLRHPVVATEPSGKSP